MKTFVIGILVLVVGCTKHNPNSCCVTDAQCAALGLDQMYPCATDKVCDPTGTCIAPQCSTSADCMNASTPICIGQLCVASCAGDPSCVGIADKPYCADDGACVSCKTNAECTTTEAPICDMTSRACRGCTYDAECPTGTCLEAIGTCVDQSRVIFLANNGVDSGTCTKASPCATLTYGLTKADAVRNVLHISTASFGLDTSATTTINRSSIYVDGIDGTGTMVVGGSSTVVPLTIPNTTTGIVLENLQFNTANDNVVTVGTSAAVKLFNVTLQKGITANAGSIIAQRSTLAAISCTNGTLDISDCMIKNGLFQSTTCQAISKRTWYENISPYFTGGSVDFENNVVTGFDCGQDAMNATGLASGSKAYFNTFACTSDVASDGLALYCDSSLDVSSNIFTWNSMHPFGNGGPTCPIHHSLLDTIVVSAQTSGTGNVVANRSTFFANFALKDFHLSAASPAKGVAQPGLNVSTDYDGHARPNPAGSTPDMGAFEAP